MSFFYLNIHYSLAMIVFLPWQIYISSAFPVESNYEYSLNKKHFFTVVEGHGGDAFYYFDNLRNTYGGGQLVPYLLILSLVFFYKNVKSNKFKIAFLLNIVTVYLFFSIAATKMAGFCYIVSPLIFLSLACFIEYVLSFKQKLFKNLAIQNTFTALVLILILWGNFDLHKIAYKHTMYVRPDDNDSRIEKINDANFIKSLKNDSLLKNRAIFYCKEGKNIEIMFYTNNTAYDKELNYTDYISLKSKGVKLAVINNKNLPGFIQNDLSIVKIEAPNGWVIH